MVSIVKIALGLGCAGLRWVAQESNWDPCQIGNKLESNWDPYQIGNKSEANWNTYQICFGFGLCRVAQKSNWDTSLLTPASGQYYVHRGIEV